MSPTFSLFIQALSMINACMTTSRNHPVCRRMIANHLRRYADKPILVRVLLTESVPERANDNESQPRRNASPKAAKNGHINKNRNHFDSEPHCNGYHANSQERYGTATSDSDQIPAYRPPIFENSLCFAIRLDPSDAAFVVVSHGTPCEPGTEDCLITDEELRKLVATPMREIDQPENPCLDWIQELAEIN